MSLSVCSSSFATPMAFLNVKLLPICINFLCNWLDSNPPKTLSFSMMLVAAPNPHAFASLCRSKKIYGKFLCTLVPPLKLKSCSDLIFWCKTP